MAVLINLRGEKRIDDGIGYGFREMEQLSMMESNRNGVLLKSKAAQSR